MSIPIREGVLLVFHVGQVHGHDLGLLKLRIHRRIVLGGSGAQGVVPVENALVKGAEWRVLVRLADGQLLQILQDGAPEVLVIDSLQLTGVHLQDLAALGYHGRLPLGVGQCVVGVEG